MTYMEFPESRKNRWRKREAERVASRPASPKSLLAASNGRTGAFDVILSGKLASSVVELAGART